MRCATSPQVAGSATSIDTPTERLLLDLASHQDEDAQARRASR